MGIPIWNHNQMNINPIFNTMKQSSIEVTKQRLTNIVKKHKPSFKLFYFNFKQDNKATILNKKFDIPKVQSYCMKMKIENQSFISEIKNEQKQRSLWYLESIGDSEVMRPFRYPNRFSFFRSLSVRPKYPWKVVVYWEILNENEF